MYYGALKQFDIANGPGCRVSLFVSGCTNRCEGCFQPETWSFTYGEELDTYAMYEVLRMVGDPNVGGLSILGGDPFEPENRDGVLKLCQAVRFNYPEKDIWVWTGYLWEDLKDLPVMNYVDVLVDGPFMKELKDLTLYYRGSSNQRVIDVQKSLESTEVVEWTGQYQAELNKE